ncbi:MAG TPA: hypothetical protein VFY67_02065 [Pyrinomonadaceae bacterium]|nr:hypothetical protein [Pyrinomonadaceae bacterium]
MELLFFLLVLLTIVAVVGHFIWWVGATIIRALLGQPKTDSRPSHDTFVNRESDLDVTERQIVKFYSEGRINDETYEQLMKQIRAERAGFAPPEPTPPVSQKEPVAAASPIETPQPVVAASFVATDDEIVIEPVPAEEQFTPPPRPPRRSFSEVLNSFMEQSNIRWGEIIGGLLIIGCSTALVISLWAQISQIPVLKFLIFTTVTAVLFGIGLYTEHRWKLPTTSRGILTIATLLVPLNFLAIAAVSASNTSGALVIGSELVAPAIFLVLVYFAGRIITPGCAHILSVGVLASSIGQLLVRHFASVDAPPALLIVLGAFPVACYVLTVGLALRVVLHDREIDESETTTLFTVLGTMSFAALLPFGLLLYKWGPVGLSMMYLAPLVTLWGLPMLATGIILWRRISNKELVASRTTGTALGILGVMIVLAGMILAWPNPSSIVPAALLNFAIFTALAVALELPVAHLIAAICFGLAYLVAFHVFAGNITWVNLRVMSLLNVSLSVSSGQALVGAFALFLVASEWLSKRKRERDSYYYFIAACLAAVVSLALARAFGVSSDVLWIVYGLYSVGAFWIAWRRKLAPFVWIGSALLLFSLADNFAHTLSFSFPWQTALLAHATLCAVAAIVSSRYRGAEVFVLPLNYSALISLVLGVVSLFQANTWEVTWMQAQRVFWIAGILLALLWLNRRRIIFNAFQIAWTCALVLTVKAALQQYDWYSYLPHAFLHPSALQIQGTVLALMCLAWIALRFLVRRASLERGDPAPLWSRSGTIDNKAAPGRRTPRSWLGDAWRLLDSKYSVDRIVAWLLLGGFMLLAVYGSLSGGIRELAALPGSNAVFDVAGFPHQEALALGSWIVLGLLTISMLASFWERRSSVYLLGALVALSAAIPLLAGLFEYQMATATAWRWLAALFFLGGSLLIWYRQRLTGFAIDTEAFAKHARPLLIALTVLPLVVLTIYPALRAIFYLAIQHPTSGVFALLRSDVSYSLPLVLVALVTIGYAVRERMPEFAFYAGAFFNLMVTIAFLLAVVAAGGSMNRVVVVRLAQLNAMTLAVYLLPWLSTRRRWQSALNESDVSFARYLLKLQLGMAVVLNALLFFPVMLALIQAPWAVGVGTIAAGSFPGWLTFITTIVAGVLFTTTTTKRSSPEVLAGLLLGVSCLIAFSVSSINGWLGLHTFTVCIVLAAWLMLAAAELTSIPRHVFGLGDKWQSRSITLAAIAGGLAVFLSLRTLTDNARSRWWSIGPLLAITALAATLNWKTLRRRYIYAAGILFNVTVSLWWIFIPQHDSLISEFLLINLIAASLAGILWLWLELRLRKLRQTESLIGPGFSFHHFVATLSLALLTLIVVVSSVLPRSYSLLLDKPFLSWLAFFSLLALLTACLWDRYANYAVAGLYSLGLIGCAIALHQIDLSSTRLAWSATVVLAAYTLLVAFMWRRRERLINFARQFGIPQRISPDVTHLDWLSAFTLVAVATATILAYWLDLRSLEFELRATAALAVAAQFLTFGLLAEGVWEQRWRRAALAVLIVGLVLFGWSWLAPGLNATWLNRSVILMLEAFGLVALYGLLLNKVNARFPNWTSSARACVPWLLGAGVVALFFCLGTEVSYQINFGAVRIHPVSLGAIGVTLAAAVVIGVLFALSPSHDPLSLSERGRMRYVYAAEVMLALLFLHIRLTLPWLFSGFIERYWPLAIMVIAYFGVVTSEALRRRELLVLAQPLERTGVFLPMLPVLGFWLASSEVDFSVLLFVVGGLYGLLSILRRSFVFGVMAAVAGNTGLWYVFHRTADYQFLQHPQLWLIPVAISVLVAAYLNEDKLTEDQMAGVRYLSLVTIYASSTADIFINGAANSPWLPLILGSFSLAGVFAGIVFRIRGLLLLGSIFLLLSIITMIWYASVNLGWTWLWYVAGIVTGATIIFMFALFEKKRSEVLRVVEGLKDWER